MGNDTGKLDLADIEGGNQFEHFTADFLSCLGYEIVQGPGEGPDGGKDLIVSRTVADSGMTKTVVYLVSCKHYGRAVGIGDEENLVDRVYEHDCDAFLGVYSTHPSQALLDRFTRLGTPNRKRPPLQIYYYTGDEIKRELLQLREGQRLVRQYLDRSHLSYLLATSESKIYANRPELRCHKCGIDLLQDFKGFVVYNMAYDTCSAPGGHRLHDIVLCCPAHRLNGSKLLSHAAIQSLEQLMEPKAFIRLVHQNTNFQFFRPPFFISEDVHRKWVHLIHSLFYFVARGRPVLAEPEQHSFLRPPEPRYGF